MSKTSIVVGQEALKVINDSEFTLNWKKLALASSGFTLLQEPEFVSSWYQIYDVEYIPVVLVKFGKEKEPLALMCLAWDKKNKDITHVGDQNAEYHGWLAPSEFESRFVADCIMLVMEHFSLKKWSWRWLPYSLSKNAFADLPSSIYYVNFEERNSLIWNLKDPDKLRKLKKSRSIKSKFNRFKKRGTLQFKIVTDEQETIDVLKTVQYQCDFRQEAINDSRPFGDNPLKIDFAALRQKKHSNTLHVSGLWLDDKLLAFHMGICDDKRVCLGTSSYDPSESKNSPGTLLMIYLAEALTEEGIEIFDLTPGTDEYKERFENGQQLLIRPTIYFSLISRSIGKIKHATINIVQKILPILNIKIKIILDALKDFKIFKKRVIQLGLPGVLRSFLSGVFSVNRLFIYESESFMGDNNEKKNLTVSSQHYEDLMHYSSSKPWTLRKDFLSNALFKFGRGETLLSSTKNNELIFFGWQTDSAKTLIIDGFPKKIQLEKKQPVLYDIYFSNINDGFRFHYLEQSLIHLNRNNDDAVYFILKNRIHIPSNKKETIRMNYLKKISCYRILWFIKIMR